MLLFCCILFLDFSCIIIVYFILVPIKTDKNKRIGMYQRGYKVMEISKELGIEKSVVSKAIKHFNSPDLNPLDYAIWGILEAAIYGKKFNTIDELKAVLRRTWSRIDVNVLASAVDNCPKRNRACVEVNGGYFEI